MRLFRWLVRLLGVGFLCGAFWSTFMVLLWPRWFTAVAAAVVCICFTVCAVLLIVASFMPKLDALKQGNALRKAAQAAAGRVTGKCAGCAGPAMWYCQQHKQELCHPHATEHNAKGCDVTETVRPIRSVEHART